MDANCTLGSTSIPQIAHLHKNINHDPLATASWSHHFFSSKRIIFHPFFRISFFLRNCDQIIWLWSSNLIFCMDYFLTKIEKKRWMVWIINSASRWAHRTPFEQDHLTLKRKKTDIISPSTPPYNKNKRIYMQIKNVGGLGQVTSPDAAPMHQIIIPFKWKLRDRTPNWSYEQDMQYHNIRTTYTRIGAWKFSKGTKQWPLRRFCGLQKKKLSSIGYMNNFMNSLMVHDMISWTYEQGKIRV